ncbi:MAG: GNAT family N-acetyltransferase [Ardenticatenaceae bacterium]|nr:GNAT family N-acetyltransferase [Ardenticatenaceae bacterium]
MIPPDIPPEFSSTRLLLRRYRPEDSAAYFQMLQANQEHLREFLPSLWQEVQNEADVATVLRQLAAEWDARNLFIFGVWEKESGSYVGELYLANPDWQVPCVELGYFLVKDKTGRGYATEAARAMIQFAFEQLKVNRIDLQCAADNLASQRVAERCGFTLEGRQRQRQRKKDGKLVDRLWYGLLHNEYAWPENH